MSARCHSWSLALAVAVVIGAAACQTDDLFTPLGTVGYTASGGLVSQAAETQGNQIMTWIFDDATIEAHLDALVAQQQADGGWPLSWEPPGDAARAEWRGKWTLDALVVLDAYGWL